MLAEILHRLLPYAVGLVVLGIAFAVCIIWIGLKEQRRMEREWRRRREEFERQWGRWGW